MPVREVGSGSQLAIAMTDPASIGQSGSRRQSAQRGALSATEAPEHRLGGGGPAAGVVAGAGGLAGQGISGSGGAGAQPVEGDGQQPGPDVPLLARVNRVGGAA